MARSLKKGPFVQESLQKKIAKMNEAGEKKVIKTWSRASMIVPEHARSHNRCSQRKKPRTGLCY